MLKNRPFFTIITCTLNSGKFISKNIKSVESQMFKNYEHIFVDGGSGDDTNTIINIYKRHTKRVKIISYLKKGVSLAFNRGINEAKGEYVFFLNSDDYFYDKKVLQEVHSFLLSRKDLDWIYGKINVIEEDGKKIGVFPLRKVFQNANHGLLKFINFVPHQSVFMKKKVFEEFGCFDPRLKLNMDMELFLRLSNKTNWSFFDRIVSNYTLRSGSLSSNSRNKKLSMVTLEKVQEKYLSNLELLFAKVINRLIAIYNKTYR